MKTVNNIVSKETLRGIQLKTLEELSAILKNSFGPEGSNSCIKRENVLSRYTKDGHTIISAVYYTGVIEQTIKDDIESITRHIVKTVGDGTTSAVLLATNIFSNICRLESKYQPATIVRTLNGVVEDISNTVKNSAKEMTLDDVYDIAMISTNGNEFISSLLKDIYATYGMSPFIDVNPSTSEDFVVKSYNGMTLNTGYCDSCYVTDSKNNTSVTDNPSVYFFEHPVDTREMGVYLDSIISKNIIAPINQGKHEDIVPTVIFAPTISQDMSSTMDSLINTMASMPSNNRLPICIITGYHEVAQLHDLAKMCGAKLIRKYIDSNIYKADVEKGVAPTPDNILEWGGKCDRIVAYSDKTTFIRPSKMYDDGEYSELYNNLVNFLEVEIARAVEDGENGREIGTLKRRLHSLQSNMVEILVGGITQADRDSLRDLIEDAVLNIRSAAEYGVGLGANMIASVAAYDSFERANATEDEDLETQIRKAIWFSYYNLITELFNSQLDESGFKTTVEFIDKAIQNARLGVVFNIRTKTWETNVKASIMSDITILNTVSKIIGLMATCNQFVLPTAMHNVYID